MTFIIAGLNILSMESDALYSNLPEASLLLKTAADNPPFEFEGINSAKFIKLVEVYNIAPLLFYKLKDHKARVPPDIYTHLKSRYLRNILINKVFWNDFLRISDIFRQNNVALLPLKGVDTLIRFYPYFDLRAMVDIDILIKEGQFAQAEKILSELNYSKKLYGLKEEYWRKHQCHITFYKEGVTVEVHWGLDFKRGKRTILPRLWERIQAIEFKDHKVDIFSPEDALFSFALHLRRFGNMLFLKQVFDVAKIIKESSGFDWDYVLRESKIGKMEATVYFILMQVSLFTKTEVPEEIFNQLNISTWQKTLIRKFILKYTFQTEISMKNAYLKAHFLLYDSLYEPIIYIVNIPYEQFCKFYFLKPYTKKADLLYNLRFIYMPISLLKEKLNP